MTILIAPSGTKITKILSIKFGIEELTGDLQKKDGEFPNTHLFEPFEIEADGRVFQDEDDDFWLYGDLTEEGTMLSKKDVATASQRALRLLCHDFLKLAAEYAPNAACADAIASGLAALKIVDSEATA